MLLRNVLALACALGALGCETPCTSQRDCAAAEMCINGACVAPGSCEGVSCALGEVCNQGVCLAREDAGPSTRDAGRDAGRPGFDAGAFDAGPFDAGAFVDAGPDAGPDSGRIVTLPDAGPQTDAGTDAGACTCAPGSVVRTRNCGQCGTRVERCRSDCQSTVLEACLSTDSRCLSPEAPYCRNDYCWGAFTVHQTGNDNQCVDMAVDYDPADTGGTGSMGHFNIEIRGRPAATWVRQNQTVSCPGAPWTNNETGTIGAGGSSSVPFVYGASDCQLDTLGRHNNRLQVTDPGGPNFTLPTTTIRLFNSVCPDDRNTCAVVASYCAGS